MDEHCTEKQATETAQVKFLTVFSSKLSGFWCDVEYSDESFSRYGVEAQKDVLDCAAAPCCVGTECNILLPI